MTPKSAMGAAMRWLTRIAAAGIVALLQACAAGPAIAPQPVAAVAEARAPVTLLVSFDGFRADYLDRGITPILSRLAAEGVRGTMRPSFPTKTFPNHYAIVTGLRPDRNGIVANRFEDPAVSDKPFTMASLEPGWWDQAEPLWVAAEKAGIRSATMFWPGSNAKVRGAYPSDWLQFNQAISNRQRVDQIIDWMRRPAESRPRLMTLYFDLIDSAGHAHGPDAPETNAAVAEADALVGRLIAELAALRQPVNLVVVADHGMRAGSRDSIIRLDEMLAADAYRAIEAGPYAGIAAQPGHEAVVEARLLRPHSHMSCWRRAEIPAHLHYGRNPRVPPYLCLAEPGWLIHTKPLDAEWTPGGHHGWDVRDPQMAAVFVANGPALVPGTRLADFDNVDVYPLLRHLVGLPPATGIDGSIAPFESALARQGLPSSGFHPKPAR